jgi:hypothetical protein
MTYKITEYDAITNETIERQATAEEIAEIKLRAQSQTDRLAAQAAEAETRATQKAALLERLGISEDEAKLLLA